MKGHMNTNNTIAPRSLWLRLERAILASILAIFGLAVQAQETQLAVSSVTASSDDGNIPANTIDGNLSTRWSANGDGQWIQFDLGTNRTVTSIAIAWYKGDLRTARFDVRTSGDGVNWTNVFSGASSGTTLNFESYDLIDTAGRFVQIVGHGNSIDLWNSIAEVRILGLSGSSPPPPTTETRLSVDSVVASSGKGAENTLDGNLSTRWSARGDGQWLLYDLGTTSTVSSVEVAWYKGNARISRFEIETSVDGGAWTNVFNGASSGTTLSLETYDVPDTRARYVSIVGHGSTSDNLNSITEVELFGLATTNTNQPPDTNAILLPSQVLDLAN